MTVPGSPFSYSYPANVITKKGNKNVKLTNHEEEKELLIDQSNERTNIHTN